MTSTRLFSAALTACLSLMLFLPAMADEDDPRHIRHEVMEGVRDAAKPLGKMMRGDLAFDSAAAMESLVVFRDAAAVFGDLFPEGTETGMDTEARDTIWTDREGFNKALADFSAAVDSAIAADAQDLDAFRKAAGPVFKQCKACHEGYRVEDD